MATLSKDSLHSVLAKVEELALPEGEYLALCGILKKEFEARNPEIVYETELDRTIVYTGKKVVTFHITRRVVYKGATPDLWRISVNGVTKDLSAQKIGMLMSTLYRANLTKTITIDGEHETTLREYRAWMETDYVDEDEDMWIDDHHALIHMASLNM
jgi:hypothetical protein